MIRPTSYAQFQAKKSAAVERKARREAKHGKREAKPRGLRPVSAKRAVWLRKYSAALKAAIDAQMTQHGGTRCARCQQSKPVQGHHPGGRIGERILVFVLLCAECHHHVHFVSPKQARAEGWIV